MSKSEVLAVESARVLEDSQALSPMGEVAVGERLLVNPEALSAGENVRLNLRLDKAFVETIRELGVLKDIDVYPTLTGLVVLDGHRRHAAALEAGLSRVPVRVVEVVSDENRIALQLVENDARLHTAALERAQAVHQLMLFGASNKYLQKHGVGREEIKAAKRLISAPASVKTLAEDAPGIDLVMLGKLAELADTAVSDSDFEDLVSRISQEPDQAAFLIEEERLEAERRQVLADYVRKLEESGTRVVESEELGEKSIGIWFLRNADGERITEEEHAECPGRVAVVKFGRWQDEPQAHFYCEDWEANGHALPSWMTRKSESSASEPSEEEKALRAEVIRKNNSSRAARQVRQEWIRSSLLNAGKLPKGWALFAAPTIDFAFQQRNFNAVSKAQESLSITKDWYRSPSTSQGAEKGLLRLALIYAEACLDNDDFWRISRPTWSDRIKRLYLRSLEAWGYTLSTIEAEFCKSVENNDTDIDGDYANEIDAIRHVVPASKDNC